MPQLTQARCQRSTRPCFCSNGYALVFPLRILNIQVQRRLENLDTIRVVTVEANATESNGAEKYEWTVTFDTEVGDLPMLEITSGRLTG